MRGVMVWGRLGGVVVNEESEFKPCNNICKSDFMTYYPSLCCIYNHIDLTREEHYIICNISHTILIKIHLCIYTALYILIFAKDSLVAIKTFGFCKYCMTNSTCITV